jgi:hypothetical protein
MESDYGIVDGFDEPPHAFIKSLLSKPIIVRKLADKFFGGDKTRVEDEYEALTEEELDKFFISEFGGGTFRAGREYSFILYGASGYTGSLCLEYILKTVQNLGSRVAKRGEITQALGRCDVEISDGVRTRIHYVRLGKSSSDS